MKRAKDFWAGTSCPLPFQGGIGLTDLWGFGPSTWATARRTRSSPGYHITGIQP
jgi:hypothetical protein